MGGVKKALRERECKFQKTKDFRREGRMDKAGREGRLEKEWMNKEALRERGMEKAG